MTETALEACRLSIGGVTVKILIEDGNDRAQEVVAAVRASRGRIAEAVVAALLAVPPPPPPPAGAVAAVRTVPRAGWPLSVSLIFNYFRS